MVDYTHKVHYYETDQMKVVHHSNYIRWFEEARTFLMDEGGIPYAYMEEHGIICPVLSVDAKYRSMTRFGDTVIIRCVLKAYNGIRMEFSYEVMDSITGELRCTGNSCHCFVDVADRLISVKKVNPDAHEKLLGLLDQ